MRQFAEPILRSNDWASVNYPTCDIMSRGSIFPNKSKKIKEFLRHADLTIGMNRPRRGDQIKALKGIDMSKRMGLSKKLLIMGIAIGTMVPLLGAFTYFQSKKVAKLQNEISDVKLNGVRLSRPSDFKRSNLG